MANPLDRTSFVQVLEAHHREVAENKFKQLPKMRDRLFKVINSDSAWESFYNVGSIPDIPKFNGYLESVGISPGYYTKIEPLQFAAQIISERRLMDTKKYPVFDKIAEGLIESANRVMEKYAASFYNNAFSTAFDFMESEEGVPLCSSSHTTKSGTSTTNGFDNAGTSAMDKTSVAATKIIMKQFRNDISERIDTGDDFVLIYPDELDETAYEIVKTPRGLDTGDGNVNYNFGRYELIPYSRLSDNDTNNWFMAIKSRMMEDALWINGIAPETKNTVDWDTYALKQAVYMVCGCGFKDWRPFYGHQVS